MSEVPASAVHLGTALSQLGMSVRDLWIWYFAIGGNGTLADVTSWVDGTANPSDDDHDLMAQALNEEYSVRDLDHPVGYRVQR